MSKKFQDNLNVLVYGDIDKMAADTNGHFLDQLSEASDDMTQDPRTMQELNAYVKNGGFSHVLIPDENFHRLNGNLGNCSVPIVEFLEDHWVTWAVDRKKQYLKDNKIKDAIVFSERNLEPYKGQTRFHSVLAAIDSPTFFNKGLERKIDILVSGAIKPDKPWVYPMRNWLINVLPEIGIKEGLNIHHHQHPGRVRKKGEEKITKGYSELINTAKIATAGTGQWRMPFKKLYEIAACETVLLSDLPLEDSDFFRGKILEIDPTKVNSKGYADLLRRNIMNVLENYEHYQQKLRPFQTEQDRFDKSYKGKALEIRSVLKKIN